MSDKFDLIILGAGSAAFGAATKADELGAKTAMIEQQYFQPPPNIKGKTDHGVKPSLTFYFENEEEKDEVSNYSKTEHPLIER